jgi:hypothetical protein
MLLLSILFYYKWQYLWVQCGKAVENCKQNLFYAGFPSPFPYSALAEPINSWLKILDTGGN